MEANSKSDHADRLSARFQERLSEEGSFLIYEEGRIITSKDCREAWERLNQFMFNAKCLRDYRVGNRHIVRGITLLIEHWGNLIPLEKFGYNPKLRIARLRRNYLNEESLNACRTYLSNRSPSKPSTHGLVFGTGRKKTPPCLVGATFFYYPGRLFVDVFLRASEVTKTIGADFHFLDQVIREATPEWMHKHLGPVKIHLGMAYCLAQWFPLFDLLLPGYPLGTDKWRFVKMCKRSIRLAHDLDHESRWKPERRVLNYVRRCYKMGVRTNSEGRVIPKYGLLPSKKKHV